MRRMLGTSSPKSSPETISSHQVASTALMRGKLIEGTQPLAAARSHNASRSTLKPTPNQRVFQSQAMPTAGFAGGATGAGMSDLAVSLTPPPWPRALVGKELRQQTPAVLEI